ncbi:hypothetical protein GCM10009624_18930 [Gordonia sinesedis]
MTDLSKVFAALADPTRRDIVARLAVSDATVGALAEPYDVSIQAVSKHLKVLEDAGLVSRGREAQTRPVHLEAEVFDLMTAWIERYRRQAEERYQRLDAVLAEMDDDPDAAVSSTDIPVDSRPTGQTQSRTPPTDKPQIEKSPPRHVPSRHASGR